MRSFSPLHALSLTLLALTPGPPCLAFNPADPVSQQMMSAEYNKGNLQEAEQIGLKLLRNEPSNLTAHYLMANIYLKQNRLDMARSEYIYCVKTSKGSQVGDFAARALRSMQEVAKSSPAAAATPAIAAQTPTQNELPAESSEKSPVEDNYTRTISNKVDLEVLEYKARLLKTGADLIAANRAKLQAQIASLHASEDQAVAALPGAGANGQTTHLSSGYQNALDTIESDTAAKIQQLEADNAAEELRITAFYKAQADSISGQKSNLGSQTRASNGDVSLMQKGTGLFVRNYVNYHGQLPLPELPPELHAMALKLSDGQGAQKFSTATRSKTTPPRKH